MGLRFHWSLSSAGEKFRGAQSRNAQSGLPNLKVLVEFCRHAEVWDRVPADGIRVSPA
jgi:hypothetical protein